LAVVFGRVAETNDGLLFLAQEVERAPEEMVGRDQRGLHWQPELTRSWTHQAEDAGQGVVILHPHPANGRVGLSLTDQGTCARILEHLERIVPGQAHGYGVVGNESISGWFAWRGQRLPWGRLKTVNCPIRSWTDTPPLVVPPSPAMARQVAAITEVGQARMGMATIALVGVGGAGSMVAEQIAHMGVGRVFICEADVVECVNLSRQSGAGPSNLGALKAEVTAASMRHANPGIDIVIVPERFPGIRSHVLLREVDLIVSCVDSAATRHEINKFSRRFLIPVIDVGATIRRTDDSIDLIAGHTARILPDGACLECEGLTTVALRERELNGRGVPYWEGDDAIGAPQIMSVNGVLASLAVTEVLRLIAGLTEDRRSRHWRYDALEGEVYAREPVAPGCRVCRLLGRGDE
jgi:molybdopterin/thiamine biosynthesis adenylyltransferase